MFMKENRNGDIKGRTCEDGRKQRETIKKEDVALPAFSTQLVFITAAVDGHEGRDISIFDILGSYLHRETDQDVIVFLERARVEIMVKVAPKISQKYVIMSSKGKPLLYVQIQNSLYDLLRSALLLYRNLANKLESYGFQIQPYNPCVSNKIINDKNMMPV